MMVNGKILCAVGSATNYSGPTYFFEFDSVSNSFTSVSGPTGPTDNIPPFESMMLDLPDGSVLYSHFSRQLYVYQPDGSQLAVRTYRDVLLWDRAPSTSAWSPFSQQPVDGPVVSETQGEAIAFHPDGHGYVTVSEGTNQTLHEFNIR